LLVDAVEESVEQVGAVALVVLCGVVALALQGRPELDAGLEERAGSQMASKAQSSSGGRVQ
jgi:hypothetical protein